jgi:hypothetical protein
MKKLIFTALAATAMFAALAPAEAAQGCGPGFHRGPYGHCRPNRPVAGVRVGPLVIGTFYPGRGYWDGHRYWMHRERWHGGWRYR